MASLPKNPGDQARKVLVIQLSALRDFVWALGAMRTIRHHHPSAQITLLTTPPFEAFAKACPYFDKVETDGRPVDASGTTRLIRRLRSEKFDIVYDFQASSRTNNYFQALRPKPPLWSGNASGCAFPTDGIPQSIHKIERLGAQLTLAGVGPKGGYQFGKSPKPDFDWIAPALRNPPRLQPAYFSLNGPYALIVPAFSTRPEDDPWPIERFIDLAKWIADSDITPVIIGGRDESAVGNQIARAEPRAKTLCTRTDLFQIAALGKEATFVIGGDTGPMQMATLAGAPGISLMAGLEDPAEHTGRPAGCNVILLKGETLEEISVKDVTQAIKALDILPTS